MPKVTTKSGNEYTIRPLTWGEVKKFKDGASNEDLIKAQEEIKTEIDLMPFPDVLEIVAEINKLTFGEAEKN